MLRPLAFTLVLAAAALAQAAEPQPVCRESSVLDEIIREVRARNYYTTVDPRLVTEQATLTANLVRCHVCVLQTPYEMTHFGQNPVRRCVPETFEVRIVPNGFVVRDLR